MAKIYKLIISTQRKIKESQKADFEKIVLGDISLINHELLVCADNPELRVIVLPSYVKSMLYRFLENKISADDLQRWAEFLVFRGEYMHKHSKDEESADYYLDMWKVIEMTSTPELDGALTPETIREYLETLSKYNH